MGLETGKGLLGMGDVWQRVGTGEGLELGRRTLGDTGEGLLGEAAPFLP